MSIKPRPILGLTALLLVGAGGYALYLVLRRLSSSLNALDSDAARATVLVCTTLLLSSLIIARSLSRRTQPPEAESAAKEALYEKLLSAWSTAQRRRVRPGGTDLEELERHLTLCASRGVLNAYLEFRKLDAPFDSSAATTRTLDRLLSAMRKDLGHPEPSWSPAHLSDVIWRHDEPGAATANTAGDFRVLKQP